MTSRFCLSDYDCLGFDMDHTVVQYHLPELFQLNYRSLANFLIDKKGYDKHLLDEDFVTYEDFSLRGLVFEPYKGIFLKLDSNGHILRACHGMTPMSEEEIKQFYGEKMYWENFPELKEKVFHGGSGKNFFRIFENFFDMPAAVISARLVDIITQKEGRQKEYRFWTDVVEALLENFGTESFCTDKGNFFPSLKANPGKFIKKCPADVISWLKKLKDSGRATFLLTQSFVDFTCFLMDFSIGEDWRQLFDFVITHAKKPEFFMQTNQERPFLSITSNLKEGTEVSQLERNCWYSSGNASMLEETLKQILKKDKVKVVYFGDSPKSDIFPPFAYASWDTVYVLEEMEAEEVHFHKSRSQDCLSEIPTKKPKIAPLLKEEKLFIASQQWGSFFCHYPNVKSGKKSSVERRETFWTGVMRRCCKIAIPLLDYITGLDLDYEFQSFSAKTDGFYPGPPSTFYENIQIHTMDEAS